MTEIIVRLISALVIFVFAGRVLDWWMKKQQ